MTLSDNLKIKYRETNRISSKLVKGLGDASAEYIRSLHILRVVQEI